MARTSTLYVFDKGAKDFTTTGLVGDLKPIEAVFTEEKNGLSEITVKIPYDAYNKWKAAKVGNIIKCAVPVRVPPVIKSDEYANTVDVTQEGG